MQGNVSNREGCLKYYNFKLTPFYNKDREKKVSSIHRHTLLHVSWHLTIIQEKEYQMHSWILWPVPISKNWS